MATKERKKVGRANASPFSPLNEERQKDLLRAVKAAKQTATEIANEFGVSRNTVAYHAKRAKVALPKGAKPEKKARKAKA